MKTLLEKDSANATKLPIPRVCFDRLAYRATLKSSLATFSESVESEEQLQSAVKQWENNCEAVSVLVQAVRSAVGYFNSAKSARDRHIDNRQKAQVKASAKAKTDKPQTTNFGASKNAIFDINLAEHFPEVPTFMILKIYLHDLCIALLYRCLSMSDNCSLITCIIC